MLKALLIVYLIFRLLVRFLFITMKGLLIIFGIFWFALFLLLMLFYFKKSRHRYKHRAREEMKPLGEMDQGHPLGNN